MAKGYKQGLQMYRIYGRLCKDAEMRIGKNGKPFWKFSVPVGENETTEWINATVYKESLHPIMEKIGKGDCIKFIAFSYPNNYNGKTYMNYEVSEIEDIYLYSAVDVARGPRKEKVEKTHPDPWADRPLEFGEGDPF